jgi:hypothetical protein
MRMKITGVGDISFVSGSSGSASNSNLKLFKFTLINISIRDDFRIDLVISPWANTVSEIPSD